MPVALAGPALGARDDPDTWLQRDWEQERIRVAADVLTRREQGRMSSGRMSVAEAERIIAAAPVSDVGQFTKTTGWKKCCDDRWCAYAVSVYDSAYMDEAHVDAYRRNLHDPEGEGWAEIQSTSGSWSSFLPDPHDMSPWEVLEMAEERGDISEADRLALAETDDAVKDFAEEYRSNFEYSGSDFDSAAEEMAEMFLDDVWQFDPACE